MKNIGLKRGSVKLVKHDKNWKIAFEKEKTKIQKVLGKMLGEIEHIGSTSVSDLMAKPIIDMLVGVKSIKRNQRVIIAKMNAFGYVYRPGFGSRNHILFAKGNEKSRTHYIHIVKCKGAKWNKDILFRDYLLKHSFRAKQYEDLKIALAKKFAASRVDYTKGKERFIKKILNLAKN